MSVVALAGRRVDPPGAKLARFPLANVPMVRERLEDLFRQRKVSALVCSAACGADLVALEVAGALSLRRRIVLPFPPERFRRTSVTDRPGEWSGLYDRIVAEVTAAGDLVVLETLATEDEAYAAASLRILDEAVALAGSEGTNTSEVLAVLVWEGRSRGADDLTKRLAEDACRRGLEVVEVRTS